MSTTVKPEYARADSCICSTSSTPFVRSMCPFHSDRDFVSEMPKRTQGFSRSPEKRRLDPYLDSPTREANDAKRQKTSNTDFPVINIPRPHQEPSYFFVAAEMLEKNITQKPVFGDEPGEQIRTQPSSLCQPVPPATIDFLGASPECRRLIYRHLLVSPSKSITFSDRTASPSVQAPRRHLQTSILYLNSQIYREATKVLYGENTFIAAHPSQLFLPNGLQGLRRRTTKFIRHLSFEKSGSGADLCYETSESLYQPIWKMMVAYPGFLSLRKLTLRREVLRPADLDLRALRNLTVKQGKPIDPRPVYDKKDMVIAAAAKLAWKAADRRCIFEGLVHVEDEEKEVRWKNRTFLSNTTEVCLTMDGEDGVDLSAENNLHSALLDILFHGREGDLGGADRAYRQYLGNRGYC
ncbi:hypothetical protein A1O1_01847 [Capronia coronata CBS 617.96]|uniref:Uncharacterized protein n=1 Tax=Capronia coronata CBS 617.96 TaxID=1182541 RepID=W9YUW2_9EURO|nr:uncharacterized protein A1O1_01847 [Capronia coronata CBS 617.96]EXJ93455.1 hypothetical protein A1O1_01847 [Capronia coronata CBS 617.96]